MPIQTNQQPNLINDFIEQIIKQAGLDSLPADFKEEYKEKLVASVQKRMGIIALKELDAEGVEAFMKFSEDAKNLEPNKLLGFLKARIPDFEEKMRVGLQEFGEEFIKGAKKLKE